MKKAYAAILLDDIREISSSGGVFSCLAKNFDAVYGVEFCSSFRYVRFARHESNISSFRGSKYIQARMGDIFKDVKTDLLSGNKVLFTGTACQINGLLLFLNKDYANLVTADVMCHGVPSEKLWNEYLNFINNGKKITNVNFRDKSSGWEDFSLRINNDSESLHDNPYMQMFLRNYSLRPSCYKCKSKGDKKMSDLTIADFWGVDDLVPEMYDNKGTSLVIVRTEKGDKVFNKIKHMITYREVNYDECIKYNSAEVHSVEKPDLRDDFYTDLDNLDFETMIKKYAEKKKQSFKDALLDTAVRIKNRIFKG